MLYPTRRRFCTAAAATVALTQLPAQADAQLPGQERGLQTHVDAGAIDHERIIAAANTALKKKVVPITDLPATRSPGSARDYYSEPEEFFPDAATPGAPWVEHRVRPGNPLVPNPDAFTAHRAAVFALGNDVAALTAASVLSGDTRYALKAADHLRSWFVTPATRMNPDLTLAQHIPNATSSPIRFEGIIETVPLAEVARSTRFLRKSDALTPEERKAVRDWFSAYSTWLNESKIGGLARDQKDHHASSWLFQCAAYADANVTGLTSDDAALDALRHRFHSVTLRAELNSFGFFPYEVNTPNPYRNSLLNLDLLTAACELMTTRFENPWQYELQDGPGLRSAIAYHYPYMLTRSQWPYPADLTHFKELPGRRISLLLAGHAYSRPEYVELWKSLQPLPDTSASELLRTIPVTQPVLWTTRPKP